MIFRKLKKFLLVLVMLSCFNNNFAQANGVYKIDLKKTQVHSWKKKQGVDNLSFVYANASEWKSIKDFYFTISRNLCYPALGGISDITKLKDILKNLKWAKHTEKIIILVLNFSKFKQEHSSEAEELLELFEKDILPFWEGKDEKNSVITKDIKLPEPLKRKPKEFNFYYT